MSNGKVYKVRLDEKREYDLFVEKDWNENDSEQVSYIKNRTHYEENRTEIIDPTWDGNFTSEKAPKTLFVVGRPEDGQVVSVYKVSNEITADFTDKVPIFDFNPTQMKQRWVFTKEMTGFDDDMFLIGTYEELIRFYFDLLISLGEITEGEVEEEFPHIIEEYEKKRECMGMDEEGKGWVEMLTGSITPSKTFMLYALEDGDYEIPLEPVQTVHLEKGIYTGSVEIYQKDDEHEGEIYFASSNTPIFLENITCLDKEFLPKELVKDVNHLKLITNHMNQVRNLRIVYFLDALLQGAKDGELIEFYTMDGDEPTHRFYYEDFQNEIKNGKTFCIKEAWSALNLSEITFEKALDLNVIFDYLGGSDEEPLHFSFTTTLDNDTFKHQDVIIPVSYARGANGFNYTPCQIHFYEMTKKNQPVNICSESSSLSSFRPTSEYLANCLDSPLTFEGKPIIHTERLNQHLSEPFTFKIVRKEWSYNDSYNIGDIVKYNNGNDTYSLYLCIKYVFSRKVGIFDTKYWISLESTNILTTILGGVHYRARYDLTIPYALECYSFDYPTQEMIETGGFYLCDTNLYNIENGEVNNILETTRTYDLLCYDYISEYSNERLKISTLKIKYVDTTTSLTLNYSKGFIEPKCEIGIKELSSYSPGKYHYSAEKDDNGNIFYTWEEIAEPPNEEGNYMYFCKVTKTENNYYKKEYQWVKTE